MTRIRWSTPLLQLVKKKLHWQQTYTFALQFAAVFGLIIALAVLRYLGVLSSPTMEDGIVVAVDELQQQITVRTSDGQQFEYRPGQDDEIDIASLSAGMVVVLETERVRGNPQLNKIVIDPTKSSDILVTSVVADQLVPQVFSIIGSVPTGGSLDVSIERDRSKETIVSTRVDAESPENDGDRWSFSAGINLATIATPLASNETIRLKIKYQPADNSEYSSSNYSIPLKYHQSESTQRARIFFYSSTAEADGSCRADVQELREITSKDRMEAVLEELTRPDSLDENIEAQSLISSDLRIASVAVQEQVVVVSLAGDSLPEFASLCQVRLFQDQLQQSISSFQDITAVQLAVDDDTYYFKALEDSFRRSGR